MVTQEELREKVSRLEALNQQIETFEEQMGYIENLIEEHQDAKKTIQKYSEEEEGSEMLVPIGASTHIYCRVGDTDKVLIGLGADTSAKKNFDEAEEIIQRRTDDFKETKEAIEGKLKEIEEDAQKLEMEVQKEYQEFQTQQAQQQG